MNRYKATLLLILPALVSVPSAHAAQKPKSEE
jgi:hypothetical protein